MLKPLTILTAVVVCLSTLPAAASPPQVEMKFATEIKDRRPIDPKSEFGAGKVYCWTHVRGGEGEFTLLHTWYREGRKVWTQSVQAKGKSWITWSVLRVRTGAWKVEIADDAGNVVQTGEFTVK